MWVRFPRLPATTGRVCWVLRRSGAVPMAPKQQQEVAYTGDVVYLRVGAGRRDTKFHPVVGVDRAHNCMCSHDVLEVRFLYVRVPTGGPSWSGSHSRCCVCRGLEWGFQNEHLNWDDCLFRIIPALSFAKLGKYQKFRQQREDLVPSPPVPLQQQNPAPAEEEGVDEATTNNSDDESLTDSTRRGTTATEDTRSNAPQTAVVAKQVTLPGNPLRASVAFTHRGVVRTPQVPRESSPYGWVSAKAYAQAQELKEGYEKEAEENQRTVLKVITGKSKKPVMYGNVYLLQHVRSGLFLTAKVRVCAFVPQPSLWSATDRF